MKRIALWVMVVWAAGSAWAAPRVLVTKDDVVIRESCEIEIPEGLVIADTNGDGVLHIEANDVEVRFRPGSILRGAPAMAAWDGLKGIGIRIIGQRGVRVVGARVHGFFNGLVASHADGLEVIGGEYSDNYRQRLKSTVVAEDGADWLFPHHADERKWRDEYGGAVCVDSSAKVVLREIRVRRGQNGIVLDRVTDSQIYDNDCSFLSGWGLALWRSSRNQVTRNAFDFCVRGHVEGVYNRGQDSAGILCFEQCNENVFAENSVTHGGDGFFGFAGREALGEIWLAAEKARLRAETGKEDVDARVRVPESVAQDFSARGCNRNLLIGNDFSYAPAHGIEMTFSEGNVFAGNRLVENAICGIWGGYSSDTLIVSNVFTGNGGMAYGLERGAINMEHASGNRIVGNTFLNNKCGIHLWWDNDAGLLNNPGVSGNARGVTGNGIVDNHFEFTAEHPFGKLRPDERWMVLQIRDDGGGHVRDNVFGPNVTRFGVSNVVEVSLSPGCETPRVGASIPVSIPAYTAIGKTRPVGARPHLRGRDKILSDEWGPWDHEAPLVRAVNGDAGKRFFDLFGFSQVPMVEVLRGSVTHRLVARDDPSGATARRLEISGPSGVMPFALRLRAGAWERELSGTLVSAQWDCVFFPWSKETDPREKLDAWRRLAEMPGAVRATAGALDFGYGWGGPRDQKLGSAVQERGPERDHFGMIARSKMALPKGQWRVATLSDDGIRVRIEGKVVLENWTWHGPTQNAGEYEQAADGEVALEVEHFEIDGYSVLKLELEPKH